MKALTIRQPWASLIAAGVKTIETRSWSTRYRGPLLIHAGKAKPPTMHIPPLKRDGTLDEQELHNRRTWLTFTALERGHPCGADATRESCRVGRHHGCPRTQILSYPADGPWARPSKDHLRRNEVMPLGAAVAVADLVDVVPIDHVRLCGWSDCPTHSEEAHKVENVHFPENTYFYGQAAVDRERPLGDFTPGRYAWLLDNVRPLREPIPAKGKQGLWDFDESLLAPSRSPEEK